MMETFDGGYDSGYKQSQCFWGNDPGRLILALFHDGFVPEHAPDNQSVKLAIDVGCGEGKNANYLASKGYVVDALDCSALAIQNGKRHFKSSSIKWMLADAGTYRYPSDVYAIAVVYGLLHCLSNESTVKDLFRRITSSLKLDGTLVLCSFNDRFQDLSGHPGFYPLLLSHEFYLSLFENYTVLSSTDENFTESHPHNNILHTHSLTRIIARRKK